MANPKKKSTEEAIRNYLLLVKDPDQLVDNDTISGLEHRLEATSDPIARAKIRAEIERAGQPPAEDIEREFKEVVKGWADVNGITASALMAEGASVNLLREAGFTIQSGRGRKKATRKRTTRVTSDAAEATTNGNGTDRTTTDDVVKFIRRTRKPFSMPEVMSSTSASRSTVKKAIDQLLTEGIIHEAGVDSNGGRGRKAKLYERAS